MDPQLDTAPCGYFSISTTGIIQSINQTLLDLIEYEREELVHQHIEKIMSKINKLFFHTYFSPHIELYGSISEMFFSVQSKSMQSIPALLNAVRQERDGMTCIDCVLIIMRKRIEHEKDLMETKNKLEELYVATHEANLELEEANRMLEQTNRQLEHSNHELEYTNQKLQLLHQEYEHTQNELMQLNRQLESYANTDALTGLRNRRYFLEKLLSQLVDFKQTSSPLSLLIIDIDFFKKINDTYGHPVGDFVLSSLAKLLQSMAREHDLAARFGGEEFVIILPNTNKEEATCIAQRYCTITAATMLGKYQITISLGATTAALDDTAESLLERADQALYMSKSNGRNRVTHSDDCKSDV